MNFSNYKSDVITEYIIANKIVCFENCSRAELLLCDTPRQARLGNDNVCKINNGGSILLDFGEELHGGLSVTIQNVSNKGTCLRIVFGESVMEALSNIGEKNSTNDHSPRDILSEANDYTTINVGHTGFRFAKLEAVGGDVSISGCCAAFEHRNIECRGNFDSSDALLNKIWHTGKRTVFLNMQDYLWDGIKRDRLVWIGDMHAEISAISCTFGECDIVNKSLDFVMESTSHGEWMNGIPSYSLWWIIIQYEWYLYTGNINYIKKNEKYILNHIKNIVSTIKSDGTDSFICDLGYLDDSNPYIAYFIDWETYGTQESKSGFYSVVIMALRASSSLCRILGDDVLRKNCGSKISLVQSMNFPVASNRQMASLMALADLDNAENVNARLLSKEPVADITTFLGYYTLLAKGKAGDVGGAIDIIKKYWGRMIELGATTFWESFDYLSSEDAYPIDMIVPPDKKDIHGDFGAFCYKNFRASLCHGWASGPTPFLSRYVLGVNIMEPGCRKLLIKPHLGGLDWVRGTYPTPFGDVRIEAERNADKCAVKVDAPSEVEIVY